MNKIITTTTENSINPIKSNQKVLRSIDSRLTGKSEAFVKDSCRLDPAPGTNFPSHDNIFDIEFDIRLTDGVYRIASASLNRAFERITADERRSCGPRGMRRASCSARRVQGSNLTCDIRRPFD